jgi:hypothetical protein
MAAAKKPATEVQWPQVVKLKHPIDFAGDRIESLTFQRGKMGLLKGLSTSMPSIDELLLIASRMCGQPVALLEQLDADDGAEVTAIALIFFGRSLPTGLRLSGS